MIILSKFLINVVLFAVLLCDCPAATANDDAAPTDADVAKYQRCGERLVILLTKFCKGCFYGGGMKPQHFLGSCGKGPVGAAISASILRHCQSGASQFDAGDFGAGHFGDSRSGAKLFSFTTTKTSVCYRRNKADFLLRHFSIWTNITLGAEMADVEMADAEMTGAEIAAPNCNRPPRLTSISVFTFLSILGKSFHPKRSVFSSVNRNDRHEAFEQGSTWPKLRDSTVLGEWILTGQMPYDEVRAEKWAPTFKVGHDVAGLESLDRKTRGRPGIVEKCCHKACSYNELKAYCDDTCPP
uniref:Insulin-like domain-containing protein n=1 Tax=Romanomermis culicivorax TaxID=13658 RepID=A0A915LBL8_ROMCU